MSDQPDRQEKQFDATPQRLRKAKEEGNIFRSREVVSVGLLFAGLGVMGWGAPAAFGVLKAMASELFVTAPVTTLTTRSVPSLFAGLGERLLWVMGPLFLVLVAGSIGFNVAQSGWNVALKPLQPKGNRISPMQGLKRLFSSRGLFETAKALSKIAVVAPLAYLTVAGHSDEILMLHTLPLETVVATAAGWIGVLLVQILLVLLVLSGVDFAFGRWKWKEDLKMTAKEIKDESKEQEGDPHMKGKRRQVARERLRRPRLDHAVLKADVVITNPTHYAIALRYDPEEAGAPRVLAKGIRKRALRIKALAAEHAVPTVENRPLARALYDTVEEQQEIPEDLYPAVAAVLAEIYRERQKG